MKACCKSANRSNFVIPAAARAVVVFLLTLVAGAGCVRNAMAQDEPLHTVCPSTNLFTDPAQFPNSPVPHEFAKAWKRGYPLLVLDLEKKYLYWAERADAMLVQIQYQGFAPQVTTTDNVIVLICKATFGDGSKINASAYAVNGPEMNEAVSKLEFTNPPSKGNQIDRMFLLDTAKGNDITRVEFVGPTLVKGKVATTKSGDPIIDTIATVLVERHRIIRFSAGGGLLFTYGRSTNFSTLTVPTTVTTTTTVSSTTVLTGTTTQVGSNSQSTPAVTNGTANFAIGTLMDRPQINGIAGLTWYPFGHDTFPVNKKNRPTITYSSNSLKGSFGVFFGTSVSSLGNFTVAPAYEVRPGIQLFAGPSWYSRSSLPANVTACSGFTMGPSGMSPSFAGPTTTSTQTQSVPGPPATTTTTTTTITIAMTNGCANGDKATLLAGSNLPTQSHYATAIAFGFVFNTNLFKAFSGIK